MPRVIAESIKLVAFTFCAYNILAPDEVPLYTL